MASEIIMKNDRI